MLQIIFSPRFEDLCERLLDDLALLPDNVFTAQHLIVPSAAVRRAVELAYADRFGIAANLRFDYLAAALWEQMAAFVKVPAVSPFAPASLVWRLLRLLEEDPVVTAHPRLQTFTRRAEPMARFQLATRLASLFDQYLTYRPEWLRSWSDPAQRPPPAHADTAWQAALWRALLAGMGDSATHPIEAFFTASAAPDVHPHPPLPAHLRVFCPPTIPPVYIALLERLSRWSDVRLYVLNPCREFWSDIAHPRTLAAMRADPRRAAMAEHTDVGHRLLSAWGNQSKAFLTVLLEKTDSNVDLDDTLFAHTAFPESTLGRLQQSIFTLQDLAPGQLPLQEGDRSLQIHVCHSLLRQLEVLHDQLLALFAADGSLRPDDVLVAFPDLAEAAPMIDAVFGTAPRERQIPYTITGRPRTLANPLARALSDLLAVARSRWGASEIFALLRHPCIARRFAFGTEDLETLERWIRQSGIRWGDDAAHRQSASLPANSRHSFTDGLERLFLGYAMPTPAQTLAGTLPYHDLEGADAWLLGRFSRFIDTLRVAREQLGQPQEGEQWGRVLHELLSAFIQPEADEQAALDDVYKELRELIANLRAAGEQFPIAPDVFIAALTEALDASTRGGTPSGYLNFAALPSLRALPYRIICMLGLDDQKFPGMARPAEFDLMAACPALGDRQRREDERNLFLDYLMSARDCFYLSYTGRDLRDNSILPPSTLIAELLDYLLDAAVPVAATEEIRRQARAHWVTEHPLQAFAAAYFQPPVDGRRPLFSYHSDYCAALNAKKQASIPMLDRASDEEDETGMDRHAALRFFDQPLAAPGPEWREPTLEQLRWFYANPCRVLLQQRLGLHLPQADEGLADEEPFALAPLVRIALAERFLPALLGEQPPDSDTLLTLACASPEAPWGHYGKALLTAEMDDLQTFSAAIRQASASEAALPPVPVSLELTVDGERWRLQGALSNLRRSGQLRYRACDTKARDYLFAWLDHLLLCAAPPAGVDCITRWISTDGAFYFKPVSNAREELTTLLRGYRLGLSTPLHFYPKSAWTLIQDKSPSKTWYSTAQQPWGEDSDPYYQLALRGVADPLDEDFTYWAECVLQPLCAHLRDPRLEF